MADVSMASILDDDEPAQLVVETPAEPVEVVEEPAVRETSAKERLRAKEEEARAEGEGKVRGPDGKFVAKPKEEPVDAKPVVEPPKEEMTAKEKALLFTAQDERRKRQELEARLKALEKPPEPEKTFWDDPEGKVASLDAKIAQSELRARLNTAEVIARQRHTDFDEKIVTFREILAENPHVAGEWLKAADPAEYAYKLAVNHVALKDAGNMDGLRAKIEADTRAKVRAELEAEYKAKADAKAKEREALPPSLGDARGTPVNRQVWAGPSSWDEILKP